MRKMLVAGLGLLAIAAMTDRAAAADMAVKAMPVKAPPIVAPFSWTGFYVGANGGYSRGTARTSLTEASITQTSATITTLAGTPIASATVLGAPIGFLGSDRVRMDGWLGGGQAGYNWQIDRIVLGIEADAQATGERGSTRFCFPATAPCGTTTTAIGTASFDLRWFGTLRGRVGYAWDRVLFYGTGGLAVGQIHASYLDAIAAGALTPATAAVGSSNVTRFGWAAGAGVEGAVTDNWFLRLEYLHVDLGRFGGSAAGLASGSLSVNIGDFRTTLIQNTAFLSSYTTRFTDDLVRVALSYRFKI